MRGQGNAVTARGSLTTGHTFARSMQKDVTMATPRSLCGKRGVIKMSTDVHRF
jgi:hypothetical protein